MEITISSFKLRIQHLEVKAADHVEKLLINQLTIKKKGGQAYSSILLKSIKKEIDSAYNEGKRFGCFVHSLVIKMRKKKNPGKKIKIVPGKNLQNKKTATYIFLENTETIINRYVQDLERKAKHKRLKGVTSLEITKFYGTETNMIFFQGFRNLLRKETADYINSIADAGYYYGMNNG